jgi:adenylate cyclase
VHTGLAVVGTIGSPRRLDYTAIGEAVDAATLIAAENAPQGTEILVSAATYGAVSEAERVRLRLATEPVQSTVEGKNEPLILYQAELANDPVVSDRDQRPDRPISGDFKAR